MNIKEFIFLAEKNENELFDFMYEYLIKHYDKVGKNEYNTYMYAQGHSSVCLIAHLDIVYKEPPKKFYSHKYKPHVIVSPHGLGADDRAGVYAIYKIIQSGLRPSIILTTGEEMGGIGAINILEDFPTFPPILTNCLIELDRRGKNDSVYYDCGNFEFEDYINSFGFRTEYGVFSDIVIFASDWDIAAVNLSVGYFNEHSTKESLNTKYLDSTIQKVMDIINSEPKYYKHNTITINLTPYMDITFCASCITGECATCKNLK